MRRFGRIGGCLLFFLFLCQATMGFAALAPPLGERWFALLVNGERAGHARVSLERSGGGFVLESEGAVRMTVLGATREAVSRERYQLAADLTVQTVAAEMRVDGNLQTVNGNRSGSSLQLEVEAGGHRRLQQLAVAGPLYAAPLVNFCAVRDGVPEPSKTLAVLDLEGLGIKPVTFSPLPSVTTAGGKRQLRLRNDLYPLVENEIWLDEAGETLRESVRDGLIETRAEDSVTARRALSEAVLARRDLVFDLSLLRLPMPLEFPQALTRLELELAGLPTNFPLLQGGGQAARNEGDGVARFVMARPVVRERLPRDEAEQRLFLQGDARLPVDAVEIRAVANLAVGGARERQEQVARLVAWVAGTVKGDVTDTLSPLQTLQRQKGNCQAHARLYVTLARALGIPSRFVAGLVYSEGLGFLYHSWAESYLDGWLPVDPTFGQLPADATHVKLVLGDAPEDLALLAGLVGRIRLKVRCTAY